MAYPSVVYYTLATKEQVMSFTLELYALLRVSRACDGARSAPWQVGENGITAGKLGYFTLSFIERTVSFIVSILPDHAFFTEYMPAWQG
jgi:hypothetical protein